MFVVDVDRDELADISESLDSERAGSVRLSQFFEVMSQRMNARGRSALKEKGICAVFDSFDLDHDGYIREGELRQIMNRLGVRLSEDEIGIMHS